MDGIKTDGVKTNEGAKTETHSFGYTRMIYLVTEVMRGFDRIQHVCGEDEPLIAFTTECDAKKWIKDHSIKQHANEFYLNIREIRCEGF